MASPAALPSTQRAALPSDWAKVVGDGASGTYAQVTIASIIALAIDAAAGNVRLYSQGQTGPFSVDMSSTPQTLFDLDNKVGTLQITAPQWQLGGEILIRFKMAYNFGAEAVMTLIGKIKNTNDDTEYDLFATNGNSQDMTFSQPADAGYVEVHVPLNVSSGVNGFTVNTEWRGGAEPSKQNGAFPLQTPGTADAYEVELFAVFDNVPGESAVIIEMLTIDHIKGPA